MANRDLPLRTSALRALRIPLEDATRLDSYLRRHARSAFAIITADWLRAGLLTGLRPCEWGTAVIEGDYLIVENAKSTNGRGNGALRHLDLSALSSADLLIVERHASRAAGWHLLDEYGLWQERASVTLYHACRRLWPDDDFHHYTLYSCRHQALATAKRSMAAAAVSALAGHATERAAQRHYGRRSSGWRVSPGAALPIPEEVATVRPWQSGLGRKRVVDVDVTLVTETSAAEIGSGMMPTF